MIWPALLFVPSMFQIFLERSSFWVPSASRQISHRCTKLSVAPESTKICLSALAYAVRNETGIFILWYLARYTVLHLSIRITLPQAIRSEYFKILHKYILDYFVLFFLAHISHQVYQFFHRDLFDLRVLFCGFFFGFLFGGSSTRLTGPIWAISAHVSLFATFEAFPFLSEGGSFVGQGSPSTGTSRGSVHGIGVSGKTLLPLLSGRLLIGAFWIEIFPSPKISLVCQILAMQSDGSLNPVFQVLVVVGWLKGEHGFL